MIRAEASTTVGRSCEEVLEFVLDLDRYRQADTKIGKVIQPITLDVEGRGTTRYWGRLRGLPPAPDTNDVALTKWSELTFTSARRQPARLIVDFTGRFACVDVDGQCRVTHSYEMQFRRPFRWIYEPLLRNWLQAEIDLEMTRLHDILEAS